MCVLLCLVFSRCLSIGQMNELLNRWRHGEVNLLQRRFRQARAQAVKQTIASKIKNLGSLTASSSNSGTATSAATSANRDGSASFGEEGSTSPASRDGGGGAGATASAATAEPDRDSKKSGEREREGAVAGPLKVGQVGQVANGEAGKVVSLGDAGGARAGMAKEAFLRVFPDVQVRAQAGTLRGCAHLTQPLERVGILWNPKKRTILIMS